MRYFIVPKQQEARKKDKWHTWFALYPVPVNDATGEMRFWETVERRYVDRDTADANIGSSEVGVRIIFGAFEARYRDSYGILYRPYDS